MHRLYGKYTQLSIFITHSYPHDKMNTGRTQLITESKQREIMILMKEYLPSDVFL